jgi:hypothetical protein
VIRVEARKQNGESPPAYLPPMTDRILDKFQLMFDQDWHTSLVWIASDSVGFAAL